MQDGASSDASYGLIRGPFPVYPRHRVDHFVIRLFAEEGNRISSHINRCLAYELNADTFLAVFAIVMLRGFFADGVIFDDDHTIPASIIG